MHKDLSFQGLAVCITALLCGCSPGNELVPDIGWNPVARVRVAHQDTEYGVPTFVWLEPTAPSPQASAEGVAWQVLHQLAPTYHLNPQALAAAQVRGVHDTGRGAIIVQFEQRI